MELEQALSKARRSVLLDQKSQARALLKKIVREFPGSEEAWLLVAQVSDTPEQVLYCLQQALKINPNSVEARERLSVLQQTPPFTPAPEQPEPVPQPAPDPQPGPTPAPAPVPQPGSQSNQSLPPEPVQTLPPAEVPQTPPQPVRTVPPVKPKQPEARPAPARARSVKKATPKWWYSILILIGFAIFLLAYMYQGNTGSSGLAFGGMFLGGALGGLALLVWLLRGIYGGILLGNKRLRGGGWIWFFAILPLLLFLVFLAFMGVLGEFANAWGKKALPARKKCPECRSWIPREAVRCQNCGQVVPLN